jgi:hypothetical protein
MIQVLITAPSLLSYLVLFFLFMAIGAPVAGIEGEVIEK